MLKLDWTHFRSRRLLYGGVALVCVGAVAVGGYLIAQKPAAPERQAQRSRVAPPPAAPVAPDISTYTLRRLEDAARLVGDARRFALQGKVAEAEAALQAAEKTAPGLPETRDARREIAELATPKGRLEKLIADARRAIERDEPEAARQAIAEAEKIEANATPIAELRQQLAASEAAKARRDEQIVALLTRMREALKHRDLAGAYRALNEAGRIDVVDPRIDQARAELDKAQEAQSR